MTTFPALTHDTLAVAIAASHYRHVVFSTASSADVDASDIARACLERIAVDDNATLTASSLLDALIDYVSDDLNDLAHNTNYVDYMPFFNIDENHDRRLFDMFISDDVATRVALIMFPFVDAAAHAL